LSLALRWALPHHLWMRQLTARTLALLVVGLALTACGEAETATTTPSDTTFDQSTTAASSTSAISGAVGEAPPVREMTDAEWAAYSAIEEDGMVCPEPNMQKGAQTWDYSGTYDPAEFGRQPSDALAEAIGEMNDSYRAETGKPDGFLPEMGWVGLTHNDPDTIVYVYPEESWQHIVQVSGNPTKGAWRHPEAIVCVTVS
jgi:hypothetical protein